MLRIQTAKESLRCPKWKISPHVDAGREQRVPRDFNIKDDRGKFLWSEPGAARREALAELHRAGRAVRRELEYAGAGRCNVLSPSELTVKLLRAGGIRDRDDDDLELHVNVSRVRLLSRVSWFLLR